MKHSSAKLFYSSKAKVFHFHNDRNKALYNRLYRELAVEFHLGHRNTVSLFCFFLLLPAYIVSDLIVALKKGVLIKATKGVLAFRIVQAVAYTRAALSYPGYVQGSRNEIG